MNSSLGFHGQDEIETTLESGPDRLNSRKAIAFAFEKATEAGHHSNHLVQGKRIRGRLLTDVEKLHCYSLRVHGPGFSVSARVNAAGAFEFRGLPEGTWKVTVHLCPAHGGGSGSAEVKTGGTVELDLRK